MKDIIKKFKSLGFSIFALMIFALFYFSFKTFFTKEYFLQNYQYFKYYVDNYYLSSVLVFMLAMIITAGFLIPVTGLITMTGGALFMQGQPNSLTDVVAEKAAKNPISWLPSVKPNPKTDLGARASKAILNEATYAFQQLMQSRIPYTGK